MEATVAVAEATVVAGAVVATAVEVTRAVAL